MEEVVGVEAVDGMAGCSADVFSKLHVVQHLVPGVQVHVDADCDAGQAAGSNFQLLAVVPLELQGEGLKGAQVEVSAQHSPCPPQSRGRGWHLRLLPRPG